MVGDVLATVAVLLAPPPRVTEFGAAAPPPAVLVVAVLEVARLALVTRFAAAAAGMPMLPITDRAEPVAAAGGVA